MALENPIDKIYTKEMLHLNVHHSSWLYISDHLTNYKTVILRNSMIMEEELSVPFIVVQSFKSL